MPKTEPKTAYDILGVDPKATFAEIKKAYRKMSLEKHPDKPTGSNEAFRQINEAYEKIKDEKTRRAYDSYLRLGGAGEFKKDDMQGQFEDLFGSKPTGQKPTEDQPSSYAQDANAVQEVQKKSEPKSETTKDSKKSDEKKHSSQGSATDLLDDEDEDEEFFRELIELGASYKVDKTKKEINEIAKEVQKELTDKLKDGLKKEAKLTDKEIADIIKQNENKLKLLSKKIAKEGYRQVLKDPSKGKKEDIAKNAASQGKGSEFIKEVVKQQKQKKESENQSKTSSKNRELWPNSEHEKNKARLEKQKEQKQQKAEKGPEAPKPSSAPRPGGGGRK